MIPIAPPAPVERDKSCKVVISAGKIQEGYCIVGTNLIRIDKDTFQLPGTDLVIDKMSSLLFRESPSKAFVAVPRFSGQTHIEVKGKKLYTLHPLKKGDYERYENKELSDSEVEMKYIPPPTKKKEGGFGEVEFFPTEQIAIKHSIITDSEGLPKDMVKEIGIYRLLSELSCLPKLYEFDFRKSINITIELGTGTLGELINSNKLDLEEQIAIMFRLLACMRSSASQGIIHCDLKPENCIISREGYIQIIDWGLAEIDQSKNQQLSKDVDKQTLWWRSPELLQYNPRSKYDFKIDIFSLGLIFLELFCGTNNFGNDNNEAGQFTDLLTGLDICSTQQNTYRERDQYVAGASQSSRIKNILQSSQKFVDKKSKLMPRELADLISHMLDINPEHRWDYDQLILHPVFQYMRRERIPKLPIFANNMPIINLPERWGKLLSQREATLFHMRKISERALHRLNTLCLSFQLLDLIVNDLDKDNIKLYSSTCVFLASKVCDPVGIDISDLDIDDETLDPKNYTKCEKSILYKLGGNILIPSLYTYVSHYEGLQEESKKNLKKYTAIYSNPRIYEVPFQKNWRELIRE